MYNIRMAPTPGWQEIPEHTMTLRGPGRDTSVVLVADEFIPNTVIGFDVPVSIAEDRLHEPIRWRGRCGMYDSLGEFRTQLSDLRNGQPVQARLWLEGFELVIYHHRRGVRSGLCVAGTASSPGDCDAWFGPAREKDIGDRLLLDEPIAYCLRFAFMTSLVDPPYIDNFLSDMDALLSYLNESTPS
ncbi:MAG TPA: hypothetical protein VMV10_02870 [Pirellulales bacterium]|nr:hypothetical protein [Pirellulales bacterium]